MAGVPLQIWTENKPASPNQLFSLGADGYIRSQKDPSLVLDVMGASTQPATAVILWQKGQTKFPNQLFQRIVY